MKKKEVTVFVGISQVIVGLIMFYGSGASVAKLEEAIGFLGMAGFMQFAYGLGRALQGLTDR